MFQSAPSSDSPEKSGPKRVKSLGCPSCDPREHAQSLLWNRAIKKTKKKLKSPWCVQICSNILKWSFPISIAIELSSKPPLCFIVLVIQVSPLFLSWPAGNQTWQWKILENPLSISIAVFKQKSSTHLLITLWLFNIAMERSTISNR